VYVSSCMVPDQRYFSAYHCTYFMSHGALSSTRGLFSGWRISMVMLSFLVRARSDPYLTSNRSPFFHILINVLYHASGQSKAWILTCFMGSRLYVFHVSLGI